MKPNVGQAIKILTTINQELCTEHLAFWVLPNIVLTLCGARAYCDGVFWDDHNKGFLEKWDLEIVESLELVKKQISVIWSLVGIQEPRPKEKFADLELITHDGLEYVVSQTGLLKDFKIEDVKFNNNKIFYPLIQNLKSQQRFKNYSEEDFGDIAFGILLGYPDKAILDSVGKWEENEPLVDANIRGADYYICPQPIYSYPHNLMNDPNIRAHEKLWSKLLNQYYTSDFHKSLEKDQSFQSKMKELGSLK